MTYDGNGNVLTWTDFDGNMTTYTYNLRAQRVSETDPTGRASFSRYDPNGNLIKQTDGAGGETNYTVDSSGNPVTVRDPLGNTATHVYDSSGNHAIATDPLGASRAWSYDNFGNPLTSTRRRTVGATLQVLVTQFGYDAAGRMTEERDAAGDTRRFQYDEVGAMTSITDPGGVIGQTTYDARGNVARIDFADGSSRRYTYDADGRKTSEIDRDGLTTRIDRPVVSTPDGMVERRVTTYPDSTTTIVEPDVVGRPRRLIDERSHTTRYEYEANLRRITDPLGQLTVHRTDGAGRPLEMVDALNRSWNSEYDGAGRLTRTLHPDGTTRVRTYDAAGRKITERDENGATTSFGYDALGRLTRVTDPANLVTRFEYDEVGNLIRQIDALGHATVMAYDHASRLIRRQRPSGQFETFAYNGAGDLTSHTDFNGQTTSFTFDANSRLVRKNLPGGAQVNYGHTPEGLRTQAGLDTYLLDARGRILEDRKATGEIIRYTYDAAGNRTSITTPSGTVRYTFDALNRIATVSDASGTTSYTYDAVGNLASTTTPNQVSTAYTYDARNRLTHVVTTGPGGLIASYTYTLDAVGKRTRVVEAGAGTMARTVDYTYDAAGRLMRETIDAAGSLFDRDIAYAYDAAGNRLRKTSTTSTQIDDVVYTYDGSDRLLTETTTTSAASLPPEPPSFTPAAPIVLLIPIAAGLLALVVVVSRRQRQHEGLPAAGWRNAVVYQLIAVLAVLPTFSELAQASAVAESAVQAPTVETISYTYDSNGNTLTRSNGLATDTYSYDAENRLVSADVQIAPVSGRHRVDYTYDADGARTSRTVDGVTTHFLVDKNAELSRVLLETTGGATVQYTHGHELVSQTRPGVGTRFYHVDGHHSVRQLTDAAGTVTDTYDFDAFGVQLFGTGTTINDFRYTGQQFDPNIGFYYMRARYYAQATGRFVTTDPFDGVIEDPPSLHRYLYAYADPVNRWDPSGETTLGELASTVAFYGRWLAIEFTSLLGRVVARSASKVLGETMIRRFVNRYAARLGHKTIVNILRRAGFTRHEATRLAKDALNPVLDKFLGPAAQAQLRNGTLLAILFAVFAGDEALARSESQALAPQDSDETLTLAGFVVLAEEDQDDFPPRARGPIGLLAKILNFLLPIPLF